MATLPSPNLGREGNPWAHAIESLVRSIETIALREKTNLIALQRSVSALTLSVASRFDEVATSVTTAVNAAIAALTLTSIAGNLDQSRITGTWTKDVATVGSLQGNTGINSVGVYGTTVATARAVQVNAAGTFGYVPSGEQFKDGVKRFDMEDPKIALAIQIVSYWYNFDPDKRPQIGVIAQQIEALGLWWLIDYDDEGQPFGFKYEMLALVILPYLNNVEARLAALEADVRPVG